MDPETVFPADLIVKDSLNHHGSGGNRNPDQLPLAVKVPGNGPVALPLAVKLASAYPCCLHIGSGTIVTLCVLRTSPLSCVIGNPTIDLSDDRDWPACGVRGSCGTAV